MALIALEDCMILNINKLQSTITKRIKKDYVDPSREEIALHLKEDLDAFTINDQKFKYIALNANFGGHHYFFLCPKCDRKVTKLFLPPKESGLEQRYLCKLCHGVKNRSLILGPSRFYRYVFRPLKRMKAIEKKLERGHLPTVISERLLNEYEAILSELKKNPDYKLFMFRKNLKDSRASSGK